MKVTQNRRRIKAPWGQAESANPFPTIDKQAKQLGHLEPPDQIQIWTEVTPQEIAKRFDVMARTGEEEIELSRTYLLVPCQLIQSSFQERTIPQLRLWLYYKLKFKDGCFFASSDSDYETVTYLSICHKTLLSHRSKLLMWNWLGFDTGENQYFLRSYHRLIQKLPLSNICAFLYQDDFRGFRIWCAAAVISAIVRWMKIKKYHDNKSGINRGKRGRLKTGPYPSLPLSNSIISKALNISIKQSSIYKRKASDHGYIELISNQFKPVQLSPLDLMTLRIIAPHDVRKFQVRGNRVFTRMPDKIAHGYLELKRSKKQNGKKGKHI